MFLKLAEKVAIYFSGITMVLFGIGALIIFINIFQEEGVKGVQETLRTDVMSITTKFIPILVVFFLITGGINHLQKTHADRFRDIISGKEGAVKMIVLAAILPGMAGGKQLKDAWDDPRGDKAKVLLCLVGMMALGINIFIFRAKVLGGPLTLIWAGFASCLLLQVWVIGRLFFR